MAGEGRRVLGWLSGGPGSAESLWILTAGRTGVLLMRVLGGAVWRGSGMTCLRRLLARSASPQAGGRLVEEQAALPPVALTSWTDPVARPWTGSPRSTALGGRRHEPTDLA